MKHIRVLSIRKNTDLHIQALEAEYLKRLKPYFKVEIEDIRHTYSDKESIDSILNRELTLFEKRINPKEHLICLHETGKDFNSFGFANWIKDTFAIQSNRRTTFLIGSSFGIHQSLLERSEGTLSLSSMTLTHEMARLILLEQIYRANDINHNGNYHK